MRWSVRAKLTALVVTVRLPLLADAVFKFWQEQRDSRERAQERLLLTAQVVARQLDEMLADQMKNLEALAATHSIDRLHSEHLAALARRVQTTHPFVHSSAASWPRAPTGR